MTADRPPPDAKDGPASPPAAAPRRPSSILFVCGMNSVRSPMAEALARELFGPSVYIASAGVKRGVRDPFVDAVLEEKALSIGKRQPQTLDDLEDDFFDLIVTLSPEAHHRALDMTRASAVDVVYWPTADPTGATGTREQILLAYRAVRDHLSRLLTKQFSSSRE
jgi:protein-tyrosine-phosphatase